MTLEERYWRDQADAEKARRLLEEGRKNNWIFATAMLGVALFIVVAPWFDSVFGLDVGQAGWLVTLGVAAMILIAGAIGIGNYLKK